eukprot:GEMP01074983.1.p2 GENE.GEMP01074983.1~~GEMP01074983.1.p2  ORF type:complete len:173 (+),score=41.70 GEMP01074983.1:171-689(+)
MVFGLFSHVADLLPDNAADGHHHTVFAMQEHPAFGKAFDAAEATNTYGTDAVHGKSSFGASYALAPGSGYWCDSGMAGDNEIVTWTGKLKRRHWSPGLRLDWAYAPGEYKVRVSQDGKHYEDVKYWTEEKDDNVSFEQQIDFDRSRPVWGVKVDMRHPRDWRYFGINQIHLL